MSSEALKQNAERISSNLICHDDRGDAERHKRISVAARLRDLVFKVTAFLVGVNASDLDLETWRRLEMRNEYLETRESRMLDLRHWY